MLDCNGQRPEAVARVAPCVSRVQVTYEFVEGPASAERTLSSITAAVSAGREHAVVLAPNESTTDGQMLRFVEQTHACAPGTKIVIHPIPGSERGPLDRRYATLLERAMALHHDTVLLMRVPGPVGGR